MSEPAKHSNPMTIMFDAIAEHVAKVVGDRIESRLQNGGMPAVDLEQLGARDLELLRAYSAKEVAGLLGTNRVESIYDIPEDELPRVRRIGKGFGYLGINILCYMAGRPPIDLGAAVEAYRERLEEGRGNVIPMKASEGLTRVL